MIRFAELKDIPRLMALLEQVNRVHYLGRPDLFKEGTKYSPEELESILSDQNTPVFVYEEGGGVRGYAFCQMQVTSGSRLMCDLKTCYIDDLCVDETCRGRGIGRALYDYVCAYALNSGCYHVTLNVWSLNPGAMRFYESLGMTPYKIGMEKILK